MSQGFAKSLFQLNQFDDWNHVAQGRLTLTSGTPVTTSDVTGATTVYYTPYKGNTIALYDNTNSLWRSYNFSEVSIAVPATTLQMYDVFIYDNNGTETLELVAWTNDTTRATALTTQDGVYVKSGDATRRYLGSFRTTGVSGQTEDSEANRLLWNYYNRVPRKLLVRETTDSWTYSIANTWRVANNNTANSVNVIVGVREDNLHLTVHAMSLTGTGAARRLSIGINSTTAASDIIAQNQNADGADTISCSLTHLPRLGYSAYYWLEAQDQTNAQTYLGDAGVPLQAQSGMGGFILA